MSLSALRNCRRKTGEVVFSNLSPNSICVQDIRLGPLGYPWQGKQDSIRAQDSVRGAPHRPVLKRERNGAQSQFQKIASHGVQSIFTTG